MKLFQYAGYSVGPDGKRKFRVCNDAARARVLAACGHTDINLQKLPKLMTKLDAQRQLAGVRAYQGATRQLASEAMTAREAARIRAEFCARVRAAWEAN
jgi:hypothetical protein